MEMVADRRRGRKSSAVASAAEVGPTYLSFCATTGPALQHGGGKACKALQTRFAEPHAPLTPAPSAPASSSPDVMV